MQKIIHKSETRGSADHGWLKAKHSFSFADYYNPQRMGFGRLRVLNDDIILPGMGFGTHPHDNMEIITIPIDGVLEHKDSMGHAQQLKKNEVQVMSAGTGIYHSEFNADKKNNINLLQIWIYPSQLNIVPKYDQEFFNPEDCKDNFQLLVSPSLQQSKLWIHQNAWISRIILSSGARCKYEVKDSGNGAYIFIIDGSADVEASVLDKRDAIGISQKRDINISSENGAYILILDVPMK